MRIGKITENALKRSVLKQIRTQYKNMKSAAVGSDCAFSNNKEIFSQVSPVTADVLGGAYYAVMKAAGSLISQGIEPDHFTLSVLLPAEAEEKELKQIVGDALEAGRILDIPYAGGHTEVTTAVIRPVITAAIAGKRKLSEDGSGYALPDLCDVKPQPGWALIITKWIALEGTAILAGERKDELVTRYPVPFVEGAMAFKELMDVRPEMAALERTVAAGAANDAKRGGAEGTANAAEMTGLTGNIAVHDLSQGGVMAALWEMAERAGCGLEADLKAIPIRQETIEVCEKLGANPYLLTSGGSLLIATSSEERVMTELAAGGINAAVIGYLREGNDRILRNDDEARFLEMPQADEIHRVLG
jgi:hydrogenase maturation factor